MSEKLIKGNADDILEIEVFGRKYSYKNSVFPKSILIKGEEILYRPIKIVPVFEREEKEWEKSETVLFENGEEKALFSIAAESENVILNADICAEKDGFIKTDYRIMSHWSFSNDCKPRITGLYIDIPIRKKYASLMHFWPNCESGVCLSGKVLNSCKIPEEEISFPFKPYMWIGWEYGGLGVCMESDEGIELHNKDNFMVITPYDEYVNLRINIFDKMPESWKGRQDEWGNTIKPKFFSIGLQATPVKKFNAKNTYNWRAFHLYDVPKYNIYETVKGNGDTMLEKIAQSGANWLILHEDWTVIQNYGKPKNEEDFKRFVKDCHKLGLKLMVYFGYEISSLLHGFNEMSDSMLNKNINGNFVGGWQREPIQRDFIVCYKGAYSDVMIERVKYVMDELGVDGIYTDGTYVPWECANEAHGCGYRDDKGNLCYKYPIYAVREHVKKLYNAVHERGGIIDTHQSSCLLAATLSYADSYFDGENIQGMVKEDLHFLKLDSFRCEFIGENLGIPCNFISYTSSEMTIEKLAGITFLHNVFPRARVMQDLKFMSKLWNICDKYETYNSEFIPYWENKKIISDSNDVSISLWKSDLTFLMCVFTADEEISANIFFPQEMENGKIKNVFTDEEYVLSDARAAVTVRNEKLNLFELHLSK